MRYRSTGLDGAALRRTAPNIVIAPDATKPSAMPSAGSTPDCSQSDRLRILPLRVKMVNYPLVAGADAGDQRHYTCYDDSEFAALSILHPRIRVVPRGPALTVLTRLFDL